MQLTIQFEAQLRQLAGGADRQIEVADGCTLQAAIQSAVGDTPELANAVLANAVLDSGRSVSRSVLAFINDAPVTDFDAPVNEGDVVLLLPPISGG